MKQSKSNIVILVGLVMIVIRDTIILVFDRLILEA